MTASVQEKWEQNTQTVKMIWSLFNLDKTKKNVQIFGISEIEESYVII